MRIVATVKNIQERTRVSDNFISDEFWMEDMIGREWEFEPYCVDGCVSSWYLDTKYQYFFHVSWLENFRLVR